MLLNTLISTHWIFTESAPNAFASKVSREVVRTIFMYIENIIAIDY